MIRLLLLILFYEYVTSIPIDNKVLGRPDVVCLPDGIRLLVNTENRFNGHVFVKGLYHYPDCKAQFPGSQELIFDVLFRGACSEKIQRERSINPPGITYKVTVVVQFHHLFITKVDRAYSLSCFYEEANKLVSQSIDVSMIPTTNLINVQPMPDCTYNVLAGSLNGPVAHYARIGDKLIHKWTCASDTNHGILVHSCFVSDGSGTGYPLLDGRGCSIDPIALGDLTYSADLTMAWVEVHAFKFADRMLLNFKCQITVCSKIENGCADLTPPRCFGAVIPEKPSTQYFSTRAPFPYPRPRTFGPPPPRTFGPPQPPKPIVPSVGVGGSNQGNYVPSPRTYGPIKRPGLTYFPDTFKPTLLPTPNAPTVFVFRPSPSPPLQQITPGYDGPLFSPQPAGTYRGTPTEQNVEVFRGPDTSGLIPYRRRLRSVRSAKKETEVNRTATMEVATEDLMVFNLEDSFPQAEDPAAQENMDGGPTANAHLDQKQERKRSHDLCISRLVISEIFAAVFISFLITITILGFCQRRYYLEKLRKTEQMIPTHMVNKKVRFHSRL